VLITGRREAVLKEAAAKYPGKIHYLVREFIDYKTSMITD